MSLILALDTATSRCGCALMAGQHVLARVGADIGKGHAEVLMGQIEDLFDAAGVAVGDVTRIGVSCGPGSFTGIRVGVAVARGLALALAVPALGISRFAATDHLVRRVSPGNASTIVLPAFGDVLYAQHFDAEGRPMGEAFQATMMAMVAALPDGHVLSGTAAADMTQAIAAGTGRLPRIVEVDPRDEIDAIAALARDAVEGRFMPPVPLYLRAPDAKPQTNFALPRR